MAKDFNNMNKHLKSNFFGIDNVIDELVESIKPWWYVNDSMMRPQIVNLWGMTGTGKTSLVRMMAKYLDCDVIQIDLGEYAGDVPNNFGYNFYEKYYDYSGKRNIIFIDEFHIARTVDGNGAEVDRKSLRSLWHLLSDGVVYLDHLMGYDDDLNGRDEIIDEIDERILKYLDYKRFVSKYMRRLNEGRISQEEKDEKWNYEGYGIDNILKRFKKPHNFFPSYYFSLYSKILKMSKLEFRENLDKDYVGTLERAKKAIKSEGGIQTKLDFSKSLIVMSGNLDEIYFNSDNFDPDIDLDILKKNSDNITLSDVKDCLKKRFRVEQIGRLGNNHIIYPVLDKKSYESIIKKDLRRIKAYYKKNMNISFSFDKNVVDIIYKEGVYPAQGARSVLSTISSIFEPVLVKFYFKFVNSQNIKDNVTSIGVSYVFEENSFVFNGDNIFEKIEIKPKLEIKRKPKKTNKSVVSAIHEAGHIVTSIISYGKIPNKASIFSTTNDHDGVVETEMVGNDQIINMEDIRKISEMALGGYAAEKVFFGEDLISIGSSSDIYKATELVMGLIQDHGGNLSDISAKTTVATEKYIIKRTQNDEETAKGIIKESLAYSECVIGENINFLKSLADALMQSSYIDKEMITDIMKEHGVKVKEPVDYIGIYNDFSIKEFCR